MRYYRLYAGKLGAGCWARTKSEARAHFKMALALKGRLPVGWKVVENKELRQEHGNR